MAELAVAPSCERGLCDVREVRALDFDAVAVGIHLEQHAAAAKDEQVRVLANDAVDEAHLLEVGELGIGLVGRDQVGNAVAAEHLDELPRHVRRNVDAAHKRFARLRETLLCIQRESTLPVLGTPPGSARHTYDSRSASVPDLLGSGPPSNTTYGFTP